MVSDRRDQAYFTKEPVLVHVDAAYECLPTVVRERVCYNPRNLVELGGLDMPLESLLQLVETLRERIETHRATLSQSEALTRYALIDPLLRELGWDTSDPAMVIPEYRSGSGSADYALLGNGSPSMMVEAKKLGTPLRDQVLAQGINYCLMEGTNHFAVTDGASWEIYETHRPVPIDQKRVVAFNLVNQSPAEVCLKALALWRPNVQSGQISIVRASVVRGIEESATLPVSPSSSPPLQPVVENTQPAQAVPPRVSTGAGWIPIIDVKPESGDRSPGTIMFPDQTSVPIGRWKSVLIEVARWLIRTNNLTTGHCPVPYSRRSYKRYVVSTIPAHQDGTPFSEPEREQIDQFHIDTKHAASQILTPTQTIIQHVGQDPAQFKVRFS